MKIMTRRKEKASFARKLRARTRSRPEDAQEADIPALDLTEYFNRID